MCLDNIAYYFNHTMSKYSRSKTSEMETKKEDMHCILCIPRASQCSLGMRIKLKSLNTTDRLSEKYFLVQNIFLKSSSKESYND